MQDQSDLTPEQRELELTLRSIPPAGGRVDATAAAFAAGRRSARRQVHLWQSAAAILFLIGASTRLLPVGRDAVPPSQDVLAPNLALHSQPSPPQQVFPAQSLFVMQQAVYDRGIDGLPVPRLPGTARPARIGNTL